MNYVNDPRGWTANQSQVPPLVAFGYLSLVSILAYFMIDRFRSIRNNNSIVRVLVCLILFDSYILVYFIGILVLGIGTSAPLGADSLTCRMAILWCLIVYALGKFLITAFLIERVHLVHSVTSHGRISRWKSRWYLGGCTMIVLWAGILALLITGRLAETRKSDGICIIGVGLRASAPGLVVDGITNVYLTTAFIVPIWRSKFASTRRLARNSCIAAIGALASTFTNVGVLVALHGREIAWICLGSCSLDIAVNASIIYFITTSSSEQSEPSTAIYTPASNAKAVSNPNKRRRVQREKSILGSFASVRGGRRSTGQLSSGGILVSSEVFQCFEEEEEGPAKPEVVFSKDYRMNVLDPYTKSSAAQYNDFIDPMTAVPASRRTPIRNYSIAMSEREANSSRRPSVGDSGYSDHRCEVNLMV